MGFLRCLRFRTCESFKVSSELEFGIQGFGESASLCLWIRVHGAVADTVQLLLITFNSIAITTAWHPQPL